MTGSLISVKISSASNALVRKPTKKSSALIQRSPDGPLAFISASRAKIAAGMSPAGSACARLPPSVPRVRTCVSAIVADDFRALDLAVRRERADVNRAAGLSDIIQIADAVQIDHVFRLRQTKLHERHQALPAGENFHVVFVIRQQLHRFLERGRREIFEAGRNHRRASWMRFHTRSGESGRSRTLTPSGLSASSTALAMAAGEGIAAPSPAAFCPSVVKGDGEGLC